jgi:hypothetical protein
MKPEKTAPSTEPTDAELLAVGINQKEVERWRVIYRDLCARLTPVGVAEHELVSQAATSILRGADGLQRILGALGELQEQARALRW